MVPLEPRVGAQPENAMLIVTYACLGGDLRRARAYYARLPARPAAAHELRQVAFDVCARHGVTLAPVDD
ncbi:MAG: hypothetical protein H6708_33620 [Kofleriaceae bacterium]|nr:hypothetical protein [Kofleriaceae bacterium]